MIDGLTYAKDKAAAPWQADCRQLEHRQSLVPMTVHDPMKPQSTRWLPSLDVSWWFRQATMVTRRSTLEAQFPGRCPHDHL